MDQEVNYYIIYKTTNLVNGKFYIGKHVTSDLNDRYLGSGLALKHAIKIYGRKNFKKDILHIFSSEDEMTNYEKNLISETWLKENKNRTYNIALGGEGGPLFKGRSHSLESIEKMRIKMCGRPIHPNTHKAQKEPKSTSWKKKMSLICKGNKAFSFSGKIWITDGNVSLAVNLSDQIPEGFERGRKFKWSTKKK